MKFCSLCQPSSLLLTSMLCSVVVGAVAWCCHTRHSHAMKSSKDALKKQKRKLSNANPKITQHGVQEFPLIKSQKVL